MEKSIVVVNPLFESQESFFMDGTDSLTLASGSKRRKKMEAVQGTKRQALQDIGNVPLHPQQNKSCADQHSNTGPFPLGTTIWSNKPDLLTVSQQPQATSKWDLSSPEITLAARQSEEIVNLDSTEEDQAAVEYGQEIFMYLREAEINLKPSSDYMSKQPDITHCMRSILVDWMVEVAEEYKLLPETLYLGVLYVDRFLSKMAVTRSKLQLLGTTCLYLAAKYEEIYPPDITEFVYVTDDTYTRRQVVEMERIILNAFDWRLICPTINVFLQRYGLACSANERCLSLAQYLCHLSLLEGEHYLKYLPSEMAAASICLARYTLNQQPSWGLSLEFHSGYSKDDIDVCLRLLHRTFCNATSHPQKTIRDKYSSDKYHGVATLSPPLSLPFD